MNADTDRRYDLPASYNPHEVEARLYRSWLEAGYFTPKIDWAKKPFVVIMPPPNVTGQLHLGHALTATIEDIMVRWHRMLGDPSLWLPGSDHSGIAAQVVVERELAKEGLTRQQLGREAFLERMQQWALKYRRIIAGQHQRLGASCDWTRERFTMDDRSSGAVRATFVRLFQKGLIYRGERIVNWCHRCGTVLSDLEVEHEEREGKLYYVRYPLEGGGYIVVATTRPETILGDTGVATSPGDPRYASLVGRTAVLPAIGRRIPIVADQAVDPAFGTGAVKVTPAHDPTDFEIGQRHGLPLVNVMDLDGTMNENAGPYRGLDRYACRERLLEDLGAEGLLEKVEDHTHSVGHCYRCKTVVEPIASQQWFVRMAPLAKPALQAVQDGRIRILPEHFTKVYVNWMENIRDWCISRQLWWGHRIPVWYCGDCNGLTVTEGDPSACAHCGSTSLYQDPDVLDTWFSSGLWPHSTLGWPEDTEDLRYFYPTSVMETAYDIIFFWVARMIMMGLENTGEVPFHTVYLHGLIRTNGEKMSKSKGNVLDPLELIAKYGTDALRIALATGTTPGKDMQLSPARLEAGRNLANKIWNAARYVLAQESRVSQGSRVKGQGSGSVGDGGPEPGALDPGLLAVGPEPGALDPRFPAVGPEPGTLDPGPLTLDPKPLTLPLVDRWILSGLNRTIAEVGELMESYQFGEAGRRIQDFFWGDFCDWYIEASKVRAPGRPDPGPILRHVLEASLRLLHPFMPFVTEEIWQRLAGEGQSIVVAPYPMADQSLVDREADERMALIVDIVRSIRNVRAETGVPAARWIEAVLVAGREAGWLSEQAEVISFLSRARPLSVVEHLPQKPAEALALVVGGLEVYLPLAGMVVDIAEERRRLGKELAEAEAEILRLEAKLAVPDFRAKAKPEVVAREEEKLDAWQQKAGKLRERLAALPPLRG
ncbi:MAG TPA: valine--tRNA ligase [Dehalococcoidia bacterium]|nr:valine--tRNA ligase [Dehalococcoidia bacterium]